MFEENYDPEEEGEPETEEAGTEEEEDEPETEEAGTEEEDEPETEEAGTEEEDEPETEEAGTEEEDEPEAEEADAEEEESEQEDDPETEEGESEEEDDLFSDLDDLEREIEEDMVEDGQDPEGSTETFEENATSEDTLSKMDTPEEGLSGMDTPEGGLSYFDGDTGDGTSDGFETPSYPKDELSPEEGDSGEGDSSELGLELTEDVLASQEIDEHTRQKNIVEGALFVAGRALSLDEMNAKTGITKRKLGELLLELGMEYLERPTALEIISIQEKWVLQIKPEYTPKVKKFATTGLIPDRILKSLTIIALKQPILKSHLIKIRGSGAYEHVKYLLDRGYCEGIKKGRSVNLTTTDQFADTFGLSRDVETLKKQLIIQLGLNKK